MNKKTDVLKVCFFTLFSVCESQDIYLLVDTKFKTKEVLFHRVIIMRRRKNRFADHEKSLKCYIYAMMVALQEQIIGT